MLDAVISRIAIVLAIVGILISVALMIWARTA